MNFDPGERIYNFKKKAGNFDSLLNVHSTYGHGSLLKITIKKDLENLIDNPIFYCQFCYL